MKTKNRVRQIAIVSTTALFLLSGLALYSYNPPATEALSIDQLHSQTAELERQISAANEEAKKLQERGDTLNNKIAGLDNKIKRASIQIELTNSKISTLEKELQKAQKDLDRQKELLRASMRALYKRGDASTVELIVGSDSFSQFMDEQEYLERLKLGIQDSTKKVIELKQQIQAKQTEQKELLEQQEAQRAIVQEARDEQATLLAETRGEESRYRDRSQKLQKQQAQLLAEIVSRSQVITGVGTGAYPWANYRSGSWTHWGSCGYGDDIDPWGYCYRQCVSYAAWKLYSVNPARKLPMYYGNASNWAAAARADGFSTGSTPKVGSVAMWGGYEGHVAYVEEILSGGKVRISEYNAVPSLGGKYSQRIIYANDPATYIYF